MMGYLFAAIVSSKKWRLFKEHSLRKSVSFEKHITSKDKYLSILSCQKVTFCIYYSSTHAVLTIGEHHTDIPQFHLNL